MKFPHFNFDEQIMVELRGGRQWMLARTLEDIWESYSSDGGRSWSEPKKRFPHINARFFLRRISSGRLPLVRHGMTSHRLKKRSHLRAFLSDDDGQTWKGNLLLDERSEISYPDGFQSPNGVIHVVYDHNRYTDAEILMAKFRDEDILAGEFRSPDAQPRILVNEARGQTQPTGG